MLQMTNIPGPSITPLVPDAHLNTVLCSVQQTKDTAVSYSKALIVLSLL